MLRYRDRVRKLRFFGEVPVFASSPCNEGMVFLVSACLASVVLQAYLVGAFQCGVGGCSDVLEYALLFKSLLRGFCSVLFSSVDEFVGNFLEVAEGEAMDLFLVFGGVGRLPVGGDDLVVAAVLGKEVFEHFSAMYSATKRGVANHTYWFVIACGVRRWVVFSDHAGFDFGAAEGVVNDTGFLFRELARPWKPSGPEAVIGAWGFQGCRCDHPLEEIGTGSIQRPFNNSIVCSYVARGLSKLSVTVGSPQDKRSWGLPLHVQQVVLKGFKDLRKRRFTVIGVSGKVEGEKDERGGKANLGDHVVSVEDGFAKSGSKTLIEYQVWCSSVAGVACDNVVSIVDRDARHHVSHALL